jgi:hypothetical protein
MCQAVELILSILCAHDCIEPLYLIGVTCLRAHPTKEKGDVRASLVVQVRFQATRDA